MTFHATYRHARARDDTSFLMDRKDHHTHKASPFPYGSTHNPERTKIGLLSQLIDKASKLRSHCRRYSAGCLCGLRKTRTYSVMTEECERFGLDIVDSRPSSRPCANAETLGPSGGPQPCLSLGSYDRVTFKVIDSMVVSPWTGKVIVVLPGGGDCVIGGNFRVITRASSVHCMMRSRRRQMWSRSISPRSSRVR